MQYSCTCLSMIKYVSKELIQAMQPINLSSCTSQERLVNSLYYTASTFDKLVSGTHVILMGFVKNKEQLHPQHKDVGRSYDLCPNDSVCVVSV